MSSAKVASTKQAVSNMLMYYHQALIEAGSSDPKREIATELAKMIRLSDDQTQYVIDNSKGVSVQETFRNLDILLTQMETSEEFDKASIRLIKQSLAMLLSMMEKLEG